MLEQVGLKFEVEPSNYEEEADLRLAPHELARKLSLGKAQAGAGKHRDAIVIAADTLILFRGRILGKPHTEAEAKEMLQTLNGRSHRLTTGFTIIDTGSKKTLSRSVETKVWLRRLTPEEIDAYVRSKEPLGKAGGYAIQGLGSVIVERIQGDYFNVVGLPLSALVESLKDFGINVLERKPQRARPQCTP